MKQNYFSTLNYSLANEDTRVEYELLSEDAKSVFSIAGSGARCLPLIAKNPKELHVVDMSEAQLQMMELRFQSAKDLSYEEWLFFLGYRGGIQSFSLESDSRINLFKKIKLTDKTKQFWSERTEGWASRGFILLGKWESHFQKIGILFRDYLRCDFLPIFEAQTLEEQQRIFKEKWPHLRWSTFIKIVASEFVFNKFLYKGHFSGAQKDKTESRSPSEFIFEEFNRVFQTQLLRKNYFMQILFLGRIFAEEGLPLEAHREIFEKVKSSKTDVYYHLGNLMTVLPKQSFDFISLSDTISYLSQDDATNILLKLDPSTKKDTPVVIRSFMRAPQKISTDGWKICSEIEKWAHQLDGTAVYQFHIFKKES